MALLIWKHYLAVMIFITQKKNPGEKSAQSLVVTVKNATSKRSTPVAHPIKKYVKNMSSGGGDKNIPSRKIESSHKRAMRKKRKTPL